MMKGVRSRILPLAAPLCAAIALAGCSGQPEAAHFDVLIKGGTVVDGTGVERYRADVGVEGDRIAAVGNLASATADRVVDAAGRIVTPGFIDLHAHVADMDGGMLSDDPRRRAAQNYVAQGVTTTVSNPDGSQPMPLAEQVAKLSAAGIGPNLVLTNGHNYLRAQVMGDDLERHASAEEIARMRELLRKDLEAGLSWGLSLGTEYFSGLHSGPEEQVELAKELPAHQGIFIPHLRSQGIAPMWYRPSVDKDVTPPTLDDAIDEVLTVAETTGARIVFTHMKAWGPGYRGQAQRIVDKLAAARERGLDIYMDVYPYDSSGSDGNFVALPPWAFEHGKQKPGEDAAGDYDYTAVFRKVLGAADAARRQDMGNDVRHTLALKGGPENVRILEYPKAEYVGKTYAELMALRGLDELDLAIALQLEGDPKLPGGAKMRSFSMAEEDIATFYRQPWCATSTDGWVVLPEEAQGALKYVDTNRRVFGSYPRRLAHYSQELGVDTLEQAVRSASGLPAEILRLPDRGRIAEGMKADLAVIDLDDLRDNTTYAEPSVYPGGVDYVLVNGQFVVDGGERTLALPGRVLTRERGP